MVEEALTKAERTLLIAARTREWLSRSVGSKSCRWTLTSLLEVRRSLFAEEALPGTLGAARRLMQADLIDSRDSGYSLTSAGRQLADRLRTRFIGEGFDRVLGACDESETYLHYCNSAQDLELCHFNNMDGEQCEILLEMIRSHRHESILDAGCGNGYLTEWIAEATGSQVIGVDAATEAIRRAQGRTSAKSAQVSFRISDIDRLGAHHTGYDIVLAIDSLYTLPDLQATVEALVRCLGSGGRMIIFHGEVVSRSAEGRQGTRVSSALESQGLAAVTQRDFTANEEVIWRRRRRFLQELEAGFLAERKGQLHRLLTAEVERSLELVRKGLVRRYAYFARRKEGASVGAARGAPAKKRRSRTCSRGVSTSSALSAE